MSKHQLLATLVVVFCAPAFAARAQVNPNVPAAAPAPVQYPAQAPAPYPAQPPAQYPAQAPAQYPAQAPAQYPAQAPAQYPAQAPAQYPAQAPAPYPAPAYPGAPYVAPNPSLESPYGQRPAQVPYPAAVPLVQSRELPRGYRTHDGFYLRMLVGPGIGGTRYRDSLGLGLGDVGNGVDTRTIGGAFMTELAIGGAIVENLILHVTMNLTHTDEVKKVGNLDWGDEELSTLMGFFGGGVTYYFEPINIYLTGSFGAGGLSQTSGSDYARHESDTGFGTSFAVGKEWWLGRTGQWAIGVALTGSYYQAPFEIDGIKSTYRGHSTGVAFSTTFN